MTPLERMSAAIDEHITAIYGSPLDRGEGEKIARAALLALAEAELPTIIVSKGISHGVSRMSEFPDETTIGDARLHVTETIFRAMLKAIAEEKPNDA